MHFVHTSYSLVIVASVGVFYINSSEKTLFQNTHRSEICCCCFEMSADRPPWRGINLLNYILGHCSSVWERFMATTSYRM